LTAIIRDDVMKCKC